MANPNFDGLYSTDNIWRGTNEEQCLTDDLDAIESDIADLESGKANTNHTHTGYADANHTHTGYASIDHSHIGYAEANHTHDGYAATDHTHTPASIGAAASDHGHSYNDLSDKPTIPSAYTHPDTHPASMITGLSDVATSGSYNDLSDKPTIPTIPTSLPADGGNADTVDGKHASDFAVADHIHPTTYVSVANEDLNDYTVAGVYAFAAAYQPVNRPAGNSNGWLVVMPWSSNASTGTIKQIWLRHGAIGTDDHLIYVRTKSSEADWSSWTTIYTTKNPPTAEEVGAATANHTHTMFSTQTNASTYKLIYLAPDGDDANTGLSTSQPMATVKAAIRKYAEGCKWLDIRLADGVYNEDIGAIAVDVANLSIRSVSENKDAVTINMGNQIDFHSGHVRLYNMTLNTTDASARCVSVNAGVLYAYGVRFTVPDTSTMSCVNVYNGAQAFLMHCVLNSGTAANSGASVYGNQAMMIKAINCTSERTVTIGVHAHNGTDIEYTDTITATTKSKETYYGKCNLRT